MQREGKRADGEEEEGEGEEA